MDISLTGFMGCGKSSVGKILQTLLPGYEYIDLDDFIEDTDGRTVAEIFKEEGEGGFRDRENDALETIFMIDEDLGRQCIISLGGGTLTTKSCRELVRDNSTCFYLKATLGTLTANLESDSDKRPMLQSEKGLEARIEELMAVRGPVYEAAADHVIETEGKSFEKIAAEIAGIILK